MTRVRTLHGERLCGTAPAVGKWHSARRRLALLSLLPALATGQLAQASEPSLAASRVVVIGITGHDQGPFSDHNETGIDLNVELQSAPLDFAGSPRAIAGVLLNSAGDTSVAYAGLGFTLHDTRRWFLDGAISAAIHDGPLHKDPERCRLYSDCGFGVRVLPLFAAAIGYRLSSDSAVSLYYDHMSHKWIVGGENEGLDHTGLRYMKAF